MLFSKATQKKEIKQFWQSSLIEWNFIEMNENGAIYWESNIFEGKITLVQDKTVCSFQMTCPSIVDRNARKEQHTVNTLYSNIQLLTLNFISLHIRLSKSGEWGRWNHGNENNLNHFFFHYCFFACLTGFSAEDVFEKGSYQAISLFTAPFHSHLAMTGSWSAWLDITLTSCQRTP